MSYHLLWTETCITRFRTDVSLPMYVRRGEERRREERAMGERRREEGDGRRGGREVERLLLSPSKSTVNNAGNYQGRHTKKGKRGRRISGGREKQGKGEGDGEKGRSSRRRVNITALCQANMRCWDTSTRGHRSYGRESESRREREGARMQGGKKRG